MAGNLHSSVLDMISFNFTHSLALEAGFRLSLFSPRASRSRSLKAVVVVLVVLVVTFCKNSKFQFIRTVQQKVDIDGAYSVTLQYLLSVLTKVFVTIIKNLCRD